MTSRTFGLIANAVNPERRLALGDAAGLQVDSDRAEAWLEAYAAKWYPDHSREDVCLDQ